MAGGEMKCGGGVRVEGDAAVPGRSGGGSVRTASASVRRCGRKGRRRQGGSDGAGIGEGNPRGGTQGTLNSGEKKRGEEE